MAQKLGLCLLAVLVASAYAVPIAVDRAIDVGKEYIYDYEAFVTAGALDPVSFASVFAIKGHLHVQGISANQAAIQLRDLTLATYNGPFDFNHYPELKFLHHSDLTLPLSKPFHINYNADRQIESIVTTNDDDWVINMKKAAASYLQIHLNEIKAGKKIFTVKEDTIHGECPVNYEVTRCPVHPESMLIVRKHRHNYDCEKREFRFRNYVDAHVCPGVGAGVNDPIHSSSFQTYRIALEDGKAKVQRVDVMSQTLYRPFGNEGLTQYSFVNHTVVLEKVQDISSPFPVEGETKTHNDLTYHFLHEKPNAQAKYDLTKPEDAFFHDVDFEVPQNALVDKVIEFLGNAIETTETSHIYTDVRRAHRAALHYGTYLIGALDLEHLKAAYNKIKAGTSERDEAIKELFLDLLPTTGTSPSALFILDLLKEKSGDKARLYRALSVLPIHLRNPTEALVEKFSILKEILNEEQDPIAIRSARLAVGNLVNAACKHNCSPEFLNKYIDAFYAKFQAATKEKDQLLYISVLSNIGYGKVSELLLPIAKGETKYPQSVRLQAMWATKNLAKTDREKLFETYLTIFYNRRENYEIRINAFTIVMASRPNFDQMQQIAVSLFTEHSNQVSHYVYTTYKSLSLTTNPCLKKASKDAAFLLKYMRYVKTLSLNPRYSGLYLFDYKDAHFKFGHQTKAKIVASKDSIVPRSIYLSFSGHIAGYDAKYFGVYIRQEGLTKALFEQIFPLDANELKLDDLKALLEKIKVAPRPTHPLKVEVVVNAGKHTVIHAFFDETTFDKIADSFKDMKSLQNEFHLHHHRALGGTLFLYEEPSELGTPVSIWSSYSAALSFKGNFKQELNDATYTRDSDFDLHTRQHFTTTVVNYNPINGFMHRITRDRFFAVDIPRDVKFGIDFAQQQVKFAASIPTDENPLEIVAHARSKVDIISFSKNKVADFLKESCGDCEKSATVSRGKDFRKNLNLINFDNQKLGDRVKAEIFDCEKKGSYGQFLHALKGFFDPTTKSVKKSYNHLASLGFSNFVDYLFYAPTADTCGIYLIHTQSEKNPVSKFEVVLRLKQQETGDSTDVFSGRKYLARSTITLRGVPGKSDDRKVEANVVYSFDKFHQNNEFKVKLQRGENPNKGLKEYVICLDYKRNYPAMVEDFFSLEDNPALYEVKSELSLLWGESEGGKCPVNHAAIKANIISKRSEKQKELINQDIWPYNQCKKDKENKKDYPGDFTPFTEACHQAAFEQTTPLRSEVNVKYSNIPEKLQTAYKRLLTLVKVVLYPYWELEHADGSHDSSEESSEEHGQHDKVKLSPGEIQIIREVNPTNHLVDLHIHSATERNHFEHVDYSLLPIEPFTTNVRFFKSIKDAYHLGLLSGCMVNNHVVTTLDNVTYHTDLTDCYTLLSSDCTEHPQYAIFAKKLSEKNLGVKLLVGGHKLEIANDVVTVNGEAVDVSKPYSYPADEKLPYFQVSKRDHVYDIYSPLYRIVLFFNGEAVATMIPSNYREQNCGLCGNFDGERVLEFIAPEKCYLKNSAEMAYAYAVRDSCTAPEPTSCVN